MMAVFAGVLPAVAATLTCEVRDREGSALPGASVELMLEGAPGVGGSVQHTDRDGWFLFSWLPAGTYRLT